MRSLRGSVVIACSRPCSSPVAVEPAVRIGAADAFTFVAVSAFLLAVALVACFLPARRATSLQPAAVLREE